MAEASFNCLAADPNLGHAWESASPHLSGIRVYPMLSSFRNYLVFYKPVEDGIELLTVLHGARDLRVVLARLLGRE